MSSSTSVRASSSSAPETNKAKGSASGPEPENYLLQVLFVDSPPPGRKISRVLSVPPSLSMNDLHHSIQIAFQWANNVPYRFEIFRAPDIPFLKPGWVRPNLRNEEKRSSLITLCLHPAGVDPRAKAKREMIFDRDTGKAHWITIEPPPWQDANGWTVEEAFAGKRERQILYKTGFGEEVNWDHNIKVIGRKPAPKSSSPSRISIVRGVGHARIDSACDPSDEEAFVQRFQGADPFPKSDLNELLRTLSLGTGASTNGDQLYGGGATPDQQVWLARLGNYLESLAAPSEEEEEDEDGESEEEDEFETSPGDGGFAEQGLNLEETWGEFGEDEEVPGVKKKGRVRLEDDGDDDEDQGNPPSSKKSRPS